jgi:hypothetical protein
VSSESRSSASRSKPTWVPTADRVFVQPLREVQAFEHELERGGDTRGRLPDAEIGEDNRHRGQRGESFGVLRRREVVAGVHDEPAFERGNDLGQQLGLHA